MAGIPDMVKLVADLATYEAAVAAGKTSPDVMYLILAEKKVFFQGEDWTQGGGAEVDTSTLATKVELEEAEEVAANALHAHEDRITALETDVPANYATKDLLNATKDELIRYIIENEEVTAAALNDLDKRIQQF